MPRILASVGDDESHSKSDPQKTAERRFLLCGTDSRHASGVAGGSGRHRRVAALTMKNHDHPTVITFTDLESALKELVDVAHLSGLVIDDLIVLLNGGLGVTELLQVIAVRRRRGLPEDC
jgi:hypothetical protein